MSVPAGWASRAGSAGESLTREGAGKVGTASEVTNHLPLGACSLTGCWRKSLSHDMSAMAGRRGDEETDGEVVV